MSAARTDLAVPRWEVDNDRVERSPYPIEAAMRLNGDLFFNDYRNNQRERIRQIQ